MSKIDTLIKELQQRKLKIDYVSYLAELIKNDKSAAQFEPVKKEILDLIDPLLLKLMGDLESEVKQEPAQVANPATGLTQDESNALKTMAQAVLQRAGQSPVNSPYSATPQSAPVRQAPPKSALSTQDKMSFAMNNRHLANKKVTALTDQNIAFQGIVVGLDAPYVVIKTDAGPTMEIPLERITVVN